MQNIMVRGHNEVRGSDLINLLLSRLHRVSEVGNGDNIIAQCPFHDDNNPSFSLNTKTGAFICFSCGARGEIHKLARRLLSPSEYDRAQDALDTFSMYSAVNRVSMDELSEDDGVVRELSIETIPALQVAVNDFKEIAARSPYKNLVNRRLLAYYSVGTYSNSVCFPYITREYTVVGVKCRALHPLPGMPKYYTLTSKNCKSIPRAFSPNYGEALFGYTTLPLLFPDTDYVLLVEGPKDVLLWAGLGLPAVATTDKLTETQISLLLEFETVILIGDNDFAGRNFMYKWQHALEGIVAIKRIKYPEEIKTLNPVDMSWPILSKLLEQIL